MELIKVEDREFPYLLKTQQSFFHISQVVYEILLLIKEGLAPADIGRQLFEKELVDEQPSESEMEAIIEEYIRPLGVLDEQGGIIEQKEELTTRNNSSTIFLGRTLLKSEAVVQVAERLQFLFSTRYFFHIFWSALLINTLIFIPFSQYEISTQVQKAASNVCSISPWYILLYYPMAISILLLHEFGHATPSYKNGAIPKSIGIGLYLVFPVLYADVTEAWKLDRRERMIINLGGMYMNLLANLVLFGLYYIVKDVEILRSIFIGLISLNVFTVIINLIPFIKFDGYWLYSDYFNLPNLQKKTIAYLQSLLKKGSEFKTSSLALKLYSIGYFLFMIFIAYYITISLIAIGKGWMRAANMIAGGSMNACSGVFLISLTVTTFIFGTIIYQRLGRLVRW